MKRSKPKLKRTRIKKKKSTSSSADKDFSKFIRARDGKCIRCGRTTSLQCSHFWPRGISSIRYDPENCDTLCYACHYGNAKGWERAKQGEYRDFKLAQLGKEGYELLELRAKMLMPRAKAIEIFYASTPSIERFKTSDRKGD